MTSSPSGTVQGQAHTWNGSPPLIGKRGSVSSAGLADSNGDNLETSRRWAGGLYELRLVFGPGYRVYFGELRGKVILLLTGGDKPTQKRDIKMAKYYWKIFLEDNP